MGVRGTVTTVTGADTVNVVNQYGEKQNGFAEVVAFCHVTCRYFDRFLLQVDRNWRQACFFYLAPGLICEEYWQVNSRRSIFGVLRTLTHYTTRRYSFNIYNVKHIQARLIITAC